MTKRKTFFLLCLSVVIVVAIIGVHFYTAKNDYLPVSVQTIQLDKGWGYEITVDGKTFIRQTNIPAVEGSSAFSTKADALLVGKQALRKLKKGKLPQITLAELKEWGIIKNNQAL